MNSSFEIVLITAYTPSIDKQDKLRELVKILKSFNYEVCLATHSPTPQDIIDRCDYFIFDKKNEVNYDLDIAYWIYYDTPAFRISHKQIGSMSTHIVPITRLVIGALSYLKTLGLEKVYMIEYDTIVQTDSMFKIISNDLNNNTISSFYSNEFNNKGVYFIGPIGINLNTFNPNLMPTNGTLLIDIYRDYVNKQVFPVTERIFYNILWEPHSIKWNDISVAKQSLVLETSRGTNGYGDKSYLFHCYDDKLHFFCSNNTNEHWKFDIIINGNNNQITVDSNTWKWIPLLNFNEVQNIKLLLNNKFIKEFDMQNQYDMDVILKWAKIEMQN
jgi:hypothetical protein